MQIPPGVNWWVHRIATSKQYRGLCPHVIRTTWNWLEVLEANAVIDAFEEAQDRG